jgi:hypothetical protein
MASIVVPWNRARKPGPKRRRGIEQALRSHGLADRFPDGCLDLVRAGPHQERCAQSRSCPRDYSHSIRVGSRLSFIRVWILVIALLIQRAERLGANNTRKLLSTPAIPERRTPALKFRVVFPTPCL